MVYHQDTFYFSQKQLWLRLRKRPDDLCSPQKGQDRGDDDPVSWHGYRGSVRGCQAGARMQEMLQDRITAHWQGWPQRLTCFWFCVPVPAPWWTLMHSPLLIPFPSFKQKRKRVGLRGTRVPWPDPIISKVSPTLDLLPTLWKPSENSSHTPPRLESPFILSISSASSLGLALGIQKEQQSQQPSLQFLLRARSSAKYFMCIFLPNSTNNLVRLPNFLT